MTVCAKYQSEIDVFYIHLTGIVTVDGVEQLYEAIVSSSKYLPTVRALWDSEQQLLPI